MSWATRPAPGGETLARGGIAVSLAASDSTDGEFDAGATSGLGGCAAVMGSGAGFGISTCGRAWVCTCAACCAFGVVGSGGRLGKSKVSSLGRSQVFGCGGVLGSAAIWVSGSSGLPFSTAGSSSSAGVCTDGAPVWGSARKSSCEAAFSLSLLARCSASSSRLMAYHLEEGARRCPTARWGSPLQRVLPAICR